MGGLRMNKYLLSTTCLSLLIFWPIQSGEPFLFTSPVWTMVPERVSMLSEAAYLEQLQERGFNLDTQGHLIESLDGSVIYADFQSDLALNPASVIKLAVSFAALARFGPGHQFETEFYAAGDLNRNVRRLDGNLILHGTGDPTLTATDVTRLARQVVRAGIRQVEGDLIVSGPLTFGRYRTTARAKTALERTLRRLGVVIRGTTIEGEMEATFIASHVSSPLREILFDQNAHSDNAVADRLGYVLGGPRAVERFLVEEVGVSHFEVYVGRASGLRYNRITPRATVQMLRGLMQWLDANGMYPEDVLPVAGLDSGTLRTRFAALDYRGAVVAKTGTLSVTDDGVSALAGVLYTQDCGPMLFAILNMKGPVLSYRRRQDAFLKDLILECGGLPGVNASSHRLSN